MEITRLPRLLGADLTEKARLRPSAGSAALNLTPLSTASLTLPEGEPTVQVRDFIELYGPEGSLGVYRVAAVRTAYGSARQAMLEHGACTLADCVTGPDTVLTGSLRTMLSTLLSCQSRVYWTLGDVEVEADLRETEAGSVSVLEALLTLLDSVPGAMLAFDQTRFPWVLHVRKEPTSVGSECRLNRNLTGVNVSLDDGELCTRVTVEDSEGVTRTFDADTIGVWGAVHRAIALEEGADPETEARRYLEAHKNPAVSIELDALALAALTGEKRDRFALGELCRVALPDWGTAMDERIVCVSYPDLYGQPGLTRLTLCSRRTDASSCLGRLQSAAARSSKGLRDAHRHIRETENGVYILAEEIELRATKAEVGQYMNDVFIRLDASDASITLHAEHLNLLDRSLNEAGIRLDGLNADLTLWARHLEETDGKLSEACIDINGLKSEITLKASQSSLNALGERVTTAEATLTVQAGQISTKVSAGNIASSINQTAQSVKIAASKIELSGYVTTSVMESKLAAFMNNVTIGTASIDYATIRSTQINTLKVGNTTASWKTAQVVTGVTLSRTYNGESTYNFRDYDNARVTITIPRSVSTVTANVETATINYLGA